MSYLEYGQGTTTSTDTVDLPILARFGFANNASAIDLASSMPRHVDIPRLREGKVGGFFWLVVFFHAPTHRPQRTLKSRSVFVPCANPRDEGMDFTSATWRVRFVCYSLGQ